MTQTCYPIRELPWDTELFGFKMGEVLLHTGIESHAYNPQKWRNTMEMARRQSYKFLLCRVDARCQDITDSLIGQGAKIGDTLITLELNLSTTTVMDAAATAELPLAGLQILAADSRDLPVICDIAAESFSYSRIYQDSRFDPTKARQFYPKWIRESYGNTERVYIVKEKSFNENILGFIALQFQEAEHRVVIRLIAIDKLHRGKGYGQVMMDWLIREAKAKGFHRIQVGTQNANTGALHLYEKNGFRPLSAKHRLHIWLD